MRLNIEAWLDNHKISSEAVHLFRDSIICYKAGADTSALLMSYLGFLIIVKQRVLTANIPTLLPPHKWANLISELQDEDKWEAALGDALQKKETLQPRPSRARAEDPIFDISDSIRVQVKYWKDRRNDCVHNKDNQILGAHVESFWSFLISNLPKITVVGGMASLVNKLEVFYDPNQTPPNQSITPIIQEIRNAVEKSELQMFWKNAFEVIDRTYDFSNSRANRFIKEVFTLADNEISNSIIDFLKTDEPTLLCYIDEYPEVIQSLGYDAGDIRLLWKTKIIRRNNALKIYASMLRNNLIPAAEIEESNKLYILLDKYTDDLIDHVTLDSNGFGKELYQRLFVDGDYTNYLHWKFLNKHYNVIRQYLQHYPITEQIVKIFSRWMMNDGEFSPWFLKDELERFFQGNKAKRDEFIKIATNSGIALPALIPALAT